MILWVQLSNEWEFNDRNYFLIRMDIRRIPPPGNPAGAGRVSHVVILYMHACDPLARYSSAGSFAVCSLVQLLIVYLRYVCVKYLRYHPVVVMELIKRPFSYTVKQETRAISNCLHKRSHLLTLPKPLLNRGAKGSPFTSPHLVDPEQSYEYSDSF